jgi:hypothetical protein
VARDLGLPPWWLNEQATAYTSGKDDPGKRRVFDHPGLRVTLPELWGSGANIERSALLLPPGGPRDPGLAQRSS